MPLRVCVDARLDPGRYGGVEQVVTGLASGLTALTDGDEQYFFLVREGTESWLRPYAGQATFLSTPAGTTRARLARLPWLVQLWRHLPVIERPARSDGTIEAARIDVVHFPLQTAFLTTVPSIYHPHDLQHVHLPQFFTRAERRRRDVLYGAYCEQAAMVAVATEWTRQDVIKHFRLAGEKVRVVPFAPPTASYPVPSETDLAEVRRSLSLPESFVFYPAQTWPHKNHIRLIEALAWLRDSEGMTVPLVCSGRRSEFFPVLEKRIRDLHLEGSVRFVDFVPAMTLQALYRLARAVVIPTLFEADSFPLMEAFHAGTPAAVSNVTSLPEQAGDAALVFEATEVPAIADAIRRLWTEAALRAQLAERGRARIARETWDRTARMFRAHYRRLAGRTLSAQDAEAIRGTG